MILWFAVAVFIIGIIAAWVMNVSPPGRYGQALEEFFPYVVVLAGIVLFLKGLHLISVGLLVLYFGSLFIGRRINRARLRQLDAEARRIAQQ